MAAVIDFSSFLVLSTKFKVYILLANFIAMNLGMLVSFFLNTFFNFKKKDNLKKRFISFMTIGYSGILLSTIVILILNLIFKKHFVMVKLISIFIVAAYQFVLNKLFTFKEKN